MKQLRHYDELGLLRPARVDQETGYRYYQADQAHQAPSIGLLRSLDVPLADIGRVLSGAAAAQVLGAVREAAGGGPGPAPPGAGHARPGAGRGPSPGAGHADPGASTPFMGRHGLVPNGPHHELYLSDVRETAPEELRTILRQPVRAG